MVLASAPRTETLFRIYFGLLAIAIVLCGVLATRYVSKHGGSGATADKIILAAPGEPKARTFRPTINWGGQKR